jgi:type I restriction enzyme S subunit
MGLEMIKQLMAMPKYEAYKDSGVEWLGQIPVSWKIKRLKFLYRDVSQKGKADAELLSVTQNQGVVPRTWVENRMVMPSGNLESFKFIEKGDFAISLRSFEGGLEYCHHDGIISPAYTVLKKKLDALYEGYYRFLFKSQAFISELQTSVIGIREGKNISFEELSYSLMPIPLIPEQKSIAAFLNRKTAQIDQAVVIKEKQIALLKERKQILIQSAVTRGLNPDAPMRDSGAEWIGEIPAHWEVARFKYCCTVASGQVDPRKEPFSSMVLIAPNHIESSTGKLFSLETAAAQGADSGKYQVTKGDLVYSKIRPALRKVCISPVDGLCSADMYVLLPKSNFNSIYLLHYILTDAFTLPALDAAMRVAMPKVNREALGDFPILMPPKEEQIAIVRHIETVSAKISQAISIQQQQIDKLKEYKATLINSAVTGKIKVSELVEGSSTEFTEVSVFEPVEDSVA